MTDEDWPVPYPSRSIIGEEGICNWGLLDTRSRIKFSNARCLTGVCLGVHSIGDETSSPLPLLEEEKLVGVNKQVGDDDVGSSSLELGVFANSQELVDILMNFTKVSLLLQKWKSKFEQHKQIQYI